MKLKYYLRGMGIGVIVTTIIMAIALERKPESLTDAQIKERAKELGMVEEELVKDNKDKDDAEIPTENAVAILPEETKGTSATKAASTTKAATTAEAATTTKAAMTAATTKASQAAVREETENGTYITIEIGAADWSNHAAQKLEEAGLVESAADFDQYLIQNGYESIIASGTHKFKVGSTYAELAKELISR